MSSCNCRGGPNCCMHRSQTNSYVLNTVCWCGKPGTFGWFPNANASPVVAPGYQQPDYAKYLCEAHAPKYEVKETQAAQYGPAS